MSVIQNIGTEQTPLAANRVVRAPELTSQQARVITSGSGGDSQEYIVKLSDEAVDVANLQEAKSSLADRARNIRIADQSMQQINDYIDQMKANLDAIVKQYPPYPPGSEERVSFLRSFNAFRRLIDRLSFQPENQGGTAILASRGMERE
jgi:hypothetical protein